VGFRKVKGKLVGFSSGSRKLPKLSGLVQGPRNYLNYARPWQKSGSQFVLFFPFLFYFFYSSQQQSCQAVAEIWIKEDWLTAGRVQGGGGGGGGGGVTGGV